jgi:hypothetical protein
VSLTAFLSFPKAGVGAVRLALADQKPPQA